MVKTSAENRKNYWKRSLINGFISALIGGLCFGLFLIQAGSRSGNGLSFLLLGFPVFIFPDFGRIVAVLEVAAFWFLTGAVIGYLFRKNTVAVAVWLIVYAVSSAVSIARYAEIMN